MTPTLAVTILGVLTLIINYANIQMVFTRRFGILLSVALPILYTAVFYTILLLTGTMNTTYGGFRGFVHLPLILLLVRGPFFQIFFCVTMQLLNMGFLLAAAKTAARLFAATGSEGYYMLYLIFAAILLAAYLCLVYKFGRSFVTKLFVNGHSMEWAVYSFSALFTFSVFAVTFEKVDSLSLYLLLMLSTLWHFIILCYAIINTHERAKQQYEAELAHGVASSWREHYQKMDGMHEKLRILRHDYKYHLNAISELLASDNKEEIDKYLTEVRAQLSESETRVFCSNHAVNALLVSYAERFSRSGVEYTFEVALPGNMPVPDYDMCVVLGNLLENAAEACGKCASNKKIELLLKPVGGQLALRVKNSFDGRVSAFGGQLRSMKNDGGFGLKSIGAVAARYGGELITDWDNDTFTAYVTMGL